MFKHKKFIFWDNDGVLVNTEKYYFEANKLVLAKAGVNLTKDLFVELFLTRSKGAWHLLDSNKYNENDVINFRNDRDLLYNELLLSGEILINGVEDVIAVLHHKYKMAIVTSSKKIHFNTIHARTGLLKYFNLIVASGDYVNSKPDPEPYLVATQKMGADKSQIIVIEDSMRGLIAAKSAGLDCIIVKNELTQTCNFTEADLVVSSINEILNFL